MADYVEVGYTNGNAAYDYYADGVLIATTSSSSYHLAFSGDSTSIVRSAIVYTESANHYSLVTVSSNQGNTLYNTYLSGTTYRVNNTISIVGTVSGFFPDISSDWYYDETVISSFRNATFETTVFTDSETAVRAMLNTVQNPGVHVQFHPVYIPSFPGVHVQFNPVLSDSNAQGGTSTIGGGDGTFDETSDAIPIPSLPSISTVDTGLVTLFRPTQQEVAALGSYLWTNFTDFIENLQKLFTNPMDYFIAFNIFPVSPLVTNARNIYIGNWATDISMTPVANQWYEFDCGTVTLQKYWGSALDYSPNTKVQLMLPYIGSVQLNTDEVMGQQIGVKYRIDLLSGSCVAMVTVNGNVYYQFTGECAVAVPLTGADWSRVYSAVIGAVGTAITGVAGGIASGAAAGAISSAVAAKSVAAASHEAGYLVRSLGEIPKGVTGAPAMRKALQEATEISVGAAKEAAQAGGNVSNGIRASRILGAINNTVGQVMGAKSGISHSGTISGSAGMLGVRDAYLIVEYPNQSLAKDYKHFVGYPSNLYARLGTLSGYTEVEQVIPEAIWGTDDELAELVETLKGGVYL